VFSYRTSLLAADRYRWYALGMTTMGQAATNILGSAFGPLAPFLQDDLHISRAEVGLISTAVFLTAAPSALFGGRAADRVGERRVLILSGIVGALAALTVTLSNGFWSLIIGCLALGLGNGMQNPAGSAAVMRWFPQSQRGFAMGIRQTGVPISTHTDSLVHSGLDQQRILAEMAPEHDVLIANAVAEVGMNLQYRACRIHHLHLKCGDCALPLGIQPHRSLRTQRHHRCLSFTRQQ
jgi:sugar phosphate permease